jgi:hypothetical protein
MGTIEPAGSSGQVDRPRARLELGHRGDEQRAAEHVLVVDVPRAPVGCEIHHQRTHDRAVVEVRARRERVDVGQQAIAQTIVMDQSVAHCRVTGRDQRDLAIWKLAMAAEQRAQRAKLEPS